MQTIAHSIEKRGERRGEVRGERRGEVRGMKMGIQNRNVEIAKNMLKALNYDVLATTSANEAINIVKNGDKKIDLVLTDVVMPEMNGVELITMIEGICKDTRCLFMSGYTSNVIAHQGVLDEGVAFIQKPFTMNDLSDKIQEVLHKN